MSKTKTKDSEKKFNKAAKIREMLATNPDINFKEVEAEFQRLGQTVVAAQFYTLKKKPAKTSSKEAKPTPKIAKSSEPVTTKSKSVAAKASSTAVFETPSLLRARSILRKAYLAAVQDIGRPDIIDDLIDDIRNEYES